MFEENYEAELYNECKNEFEKMKGIAEILFESLKSVSNQEERVYDLLVHHIRERKFASHSFDEVKMMFQEYIQKINLKIRRIDKYTEKMEQLLDLKTKGTTDIDDEAALKVILEYIRLSSLDLNSDSLEELDEIQEELFDYNELEKGQEVKITVQTFRRMIENEIYELISLLQSGFNDFEDVQVDPIDEDELISQHSN